MVDEGPFRAVTLQFTEATRFRIPLSIRWMNQSKRGCRLMQTWKSRWIDERSPVIINVSESLHI